LFFFFLFSPFLTSFLRTDGLLHALQGSLARRNQSVWVGPAFPTPFPSFPRRRRPVSHFSGLWLTFFPFYSASAPAKQVYEKFGITGPNVAARVQKTVKHYKSLGHPVYSPVSTQINV
jgi:hypothetical protein